MFLFRVAWCGGGTNLVAKTAAVPVLSECPVLCGVLVFNLVEGFDMLSGVLWSRNWNSCLDPLLGRAWYSKSYACFEERAACFMTPSGLFFYRSFASTEGLPN